MVEYEAATKGADKIILSDTDFMYYELLKNILIQLKKLNQNKK